MSLIEVAFITGPALVVSGAVYIADRLSHSAGRHKIAPQRSHAAPRDPFADEDDHADPYGEQYIARLTADEKPGPDLDALRPGPVGTGWFEALPDDEPADITGVQPADVRYLGVSSGEYVDELFSKHAEAQQ